MAAKARCLKNIPRSSYLIEIIKALGLPVCALAALVSLDIILFWIRSLNLPINEIQQAGDSEPCWLKSNPISDKYGEHGGGNSNTRYVKCVSRFTFRVPGVGCSGALVRASPVKAHLNFI